MLRFATLCALVLVGVLRAAEAPVPAVRVLVVTGQNTHDWRTTTPLLRQALERTGRFDVRVTEEFRGMGPETLLPYDDPIVGGLEFEKDNQILVDKFGCDRVTN